MPERLGIPAVRLPDLMAAVSAIGSETTLNAVLHKIVESAISLVGCQYGALGVLDADRSQLVEFVYAGIDADTADRIGHLPTGGGLLGVVIDQGRSVRVAHMSEDERSVGFPPHHPPMDSFLGVPVRVQGEVWGNLYLTEKDGGFAAEDELLVECLATVAGVAVHHARLAEDAEAASEELKRMRLLEERERIARDLHDTVIQRIFAAGMSLELAAQEADETVAERLAQVVDQLDTTIRDIRSTIFALHRAPRFKTGLRARLDDVAQEATRALGFRPSMRFDGPLDTVVDEAVAGQVEAVVREGLTNVVRHAGASQAAVSVTALHGRLVVLIDDNGRGVPEVVEPGGHGLSNLSERARQLGGELTIAEGPEGGTRVRWEAPLDVQ